MGKIRSHITSSQPLETTNQPSGKRIFTVPDGHDDNPMSGLGYGRGDEAASVDPRPALSRSQKFEIPNGGRQITPQEFNNIRKEYQQQSEQAQSSALEYAKTRVELLTGIGRKIDHIKYFDENTKQTVVYSIRTLKGREHFALSEIIESAKTATLKDGTVMLTLCSVYDIQIEALKHSLFAIDNVDINTVLGVSMLPESERLLAREEFLHEMDNHLRAYIYKRYDTLTQTINNEYGVRSAKDAEEVAEAIRKSGQVA